MEIIPFYVDFSAERFCDDIPSQQLAAAAMLYIVYIFVLQHRYFFSRSTPALLLRAGKTSLSRSEKAKTCLLLDFCRTIIKLYW